MTKHEFEDVSTIKLETVLAGANSLDVHAWKIQCTNAKHSINIDDEIHVCICKKEIEAVIVNIGKAPDYQNQPYALDVSCVEDHSRRQTPCTQGAQGEVYISRALGEVYISLPVPAQQGSRTWKARLTTRVQGANKSNDNASKRRQDITPTITITRSGNMYP